MVLNLCRLILSDGRLLEGSLEGIKTLKTRLYKWVSNQDKAIAPIR